MSEDHTITRQEILGFCFGDPSAHPPTPQETPISAAFSGSVFETPKNNGGPFEESSGWTPRFAEEYSVFNSTPGNLRGSSAPFADFAISTPYQAASHHRRLLSAGSAAAEIATHVNHLSPTSSLPLPPVDPSRRLLSSPSPLLAGPSPTEAEFQTASQQRSSKKVCRENPQEGKVQTATPPPSAHKGTRRLAPKLQTTMQNESFEHEFVAGTPQQQHHMPNFIATTPTDVFGFPLSAPATAPVFTESRPFWDSDMSGMDIDFSAASANVFQTSGHRPMSSLDWGKSNEIFQATGVAPPQNQETRRPQRKERMLAPKPAAPPLETNNMDPWLWVDPGLLFTQPPPPGMEPAIFNPMAQQSFIQSMPQPELPPSLPKPSKRGGVRRTNSTKETSNGKKVDRVSTSSPIKPSGRPGLSRSLSENRGRKSGGARTTNLPNLAPAVRPAQTYGSDRSVSQGSRSSGRISPSKIHQRLTSLTSIPESAGPQLRTSVKFTIDSRGRARAETTVIAEDEGSATTVLRRQRDTSSKTKNWDLSEEDESSSDDEPIIIPSRNTSFAMPEPRKPTLPQSFHSAQRSFSEQSTSSLGIYYNELPPSQSEVGSETETVLNVPISSSRGDAASELRKVVEDRQKRLPSLNTSQRFVSGQPHSAGSTLSPTTLTDASVPTPCSSHGNSIRCVCNNTNSRTNGDGYLVQCESCEYWLHGKCINITRQTLPRVYICAFCADTPNAHGMRGREIRRNMGGSNPQISATSPLAHKSFRSFR
ncbi:hypothetical protein F4778DRAFT_775158 [Xylariomycetidae sp. FL2044]|nr:hypothetical protein F4778DRAFT_775158 [Xylariomycetidae sp. FL2044]